MNKNLYIIAGANGSGKTTFIKEILKVENIIFINADEIAKELNPDNIYSIKLKAGKETFKRIYENISLGKDIAIETTLSGLTHINIIKIAKKLGYNIIMYYIFLQNTDTCIDRIKIRVINGGHDIPVNDVIRRYYRSKYNFINIYQKYLDNWFIFYNGDEGYINVANKKDNDIEIINKKLYNLFNESIENDK